MGEPSLQRPPAHMRSKTEQLKLLQHEYPQAKLEQIGDTWAVYTLHGVGTTEEEAVHNAFRTLARMQEDGRSLPQLLDDIRADLRGTPGMSKTRHDSLQDLLDTASNCLNDGVLVKTVNWIEVPRYTREIETLRRRVSERLAMTAKDLKDQEDARRKASVKVDKTGAEFIPGVGIKRPSQKGGLWALFE